MSENLPSLLLKCFFPWQTIKQISSINNSGISRSRNKSRIFETILSLPSVEAVSESRDHSYFTVADFVGYLHY